MVVRTHLKENEELIVILNIAKNKNISVSDKTLARKNLENPFIDFPIMELEIFENGEFYLRGRSYSPFNNYINFYEFCDILLRLRPEDYEKWKNKIKKKLKNYY